MDLFKTFAIFDIFLLNMSLYLSIGLNLSHNMEGTIEGWIVQESDIKVKKLIMIKVMRRALLLLKM
jgi:hypothetical protein